VAGDAGEDGLFSIDPAQRIGALSGVLKPAVDETFRAFDPGQGLLLPPSLDDWLAAEHLVRFIAELLMSTWICRGFRPVTPRGVVARRMIRS